MKAPSLVSIIIPCYQQAHFLADAIDSALAQTYPNVEVVVVNDGSKDDTSDVVRSYGERIRYVEQDNQGLAKARNSGVRASLGTYILPLDADDRIGPRYLDEAIAVLEANERVGVVYSKARYFGEIDVPWNLPDFSIDLMLLENRVFCSGVFRRSDYDEIGGYDPAFSRCYEDWDFWLCMIEKDRDFFQLPDVHFFYRYHEASMIRKSDSCAAYEMRRILYQKHFDLYFRYYDPFRCAKNLHAVRAQLEMILKSRCYRYGRKVSIGIKCICSPINRVVAGCSRWF